MTGRRAKDGVTLLVTAAMIAAPMAVQAQAKGQSDRAVTILMEFAWNSLPRQFRSSDGEVIVIDRANKNEVMVPLEKARQIVNVGDLSARAQYCDLPEEQTANFQSMMRREVGSEKWTKQQMVFITLLHATTVAYLTGTMKVLFQGEGDAAPEIVTKGPVWTEPCTDKVREDIKSRITAYIAEAPPIPVAKDDIAGKRAEPVFGTVAK
jgi:hypothetical protein